MGKISLIGRSLAKEGVIFTYSGQADECAKCKLVNICQDLENGNRYRVIKVRKKEHDCPVHEKGKVVVVEIEEASLELSLSNRKAMEGAVVELDIEGCPLIWCPNHGYCRRELFSKGQKVSVIKVGKVMDCPRGLKLKRSQVKLV